MICAWANPDQANAHRPAVNNEYLIVGEKSRLEKRGSPKLLHARDELQKRRGVKPVPKEESVERLLFFCCLVTNVNEEKEAQSKKSRKRATSNKRMVGW